MGISNRNAMESDLSQRAGVAYDAWTQTLMPNQLADLRDTERAVRRNNANWRKHAIIGLDSDELEQLAAKQKAYAAKLAATTPSAGVEAKDLLAYLAKHLDTAELAALKAQAAGEPTDKATLKSARHKAKHAILVMR